MDIEIDRATEHRLRDYFDGIGDVLGTPQRRAHFASYMLGLVSEGGRKNMEVIAAQTCASARHVDAAHQRIQDFITDSRWDDHAVRLAAARYTLEPMTKAALPWAWIIDDTGFLKRASTRSA